MVFLENLPVFFLVVFVLFILGVAFYASVSADSFYLVDVWSDVNGEDLNVQDVNARAIQADYFFGGEFVGDGSGLVNLPAIVAGSCDNNVDCTIIGTIDTAFDANFGTIGAGNIFGVFIGDGAGLTGISYTVDSTLDSNGDADLNWLGTSHLFSVDQNFVSVGISGGIYAIDGDSKLIWDSYLSNLVVGFDDAEGMSATGMGSTVIGMNSGATMVASDDGAFAGGRANMSTMLSAGEGSFVYGYALALMQADGWGAIAMGLDAKAFGNGAVALGYDTNATGAGSFAVGYGSSAIGQASAVIGDSLTNYKANSLLVQDLNVLGDSNFSSLQATNIYVDSNVYALDANLGGVKIPQVYSVTTEPTGFADRTSSTLGFVDATRVFTITGANFPVYVNGVEYLKNTENITVADTTGTHWVYYAANGVLSQDTTIPSFSLPLIATIYYNTDGGFDKGSLGEERHGITMDGDTHALLHYTVGTRYESGLTGTFLDNTFDTTQGIIDDEDITHTIGAETTCKVFYKDGAADFIWTTEQAEYYHEVGGVLQYNNGNVLTNVTPASHVAYWVFATNDTTTPIYSLMGQRQDVTLANARLNNTYESLTLGALPFEEMKLLYRVILKNVAGTTTYVETQDLRSVSNLPAGTYVATAHNVLTGLNWSQAGHTFDEDLNLGIYGLKAFGDSNFHTLGIGNSLFVTQDINVGGSITAPFFFGDGGGLSGIIATNITPDTTCDNNLDCQNWLFGLDLNTSLKADLNANFYGKLDVNENFVPYIGATKDVNIGTNALTAGLDSNIGSPTEFWQYTTKDFSGIALPMLLPHSTIGNYGAIEGGISIVESNEAGSITLGLYDYATTGYWVFDYLTDTGRLNLYNDTADSPFFITANTSNIGDFNATGDINAGSDVNVTGSVQATAFFGDGSGLSGILSTDTNFQTVGADFNRMYHSVFDLNAFYYKIADVNAHFAPLFSPNFTGDSNFVSLGVGSGGYFGADVNVAGSVQATAFFGDGSGLSGILSTDTNFQTVGADFNLQYWSKFDSNATTGVYIGSTFDTHVPNLTYDTTAGYVAANHLCDVNYLGSHLCSVDEMIISIRLAENVTWSGSSWASEGAPGYLAEANDCSGYTVGSSASLASFWNFDNNKASLVNCAQTKSLACCR